MQRAKKWNEYKILNGTIEVVKFAYIIKNLEFFYQNNF